MQRQLLQILCTFRVYSLHGSAHPHLTHITKSTHSHLHTPSLIRIHQRWHARQTTTIQNQPIPFITNLLAVFVLFVLVFFVNVQLIEITNTFRSLVVVCDFLFVCLCRCTKFYLEFGFCVYGAIEGFTV